MTDVWRLYETHAADFDRDRGRDLAERRYLAFLSERLVRGAAILDLGCGGGDPIARFLIDAGFKVTGVDASASMIALCTARFPNAVWITADMRSLDLGRRFDAIVAWNSFFHLSGAEQRAMFAVFARHAAPGGMLLFTSGHCEGERTADFHGDALVHASLDPREYRSLLAASGFSVQLFRRRDPHCGHHTVWLAGSRAGPVTDPA